MNILLTSVGRRAYMVNYFKEVIDGKVHAVNSEYTYAMQIADANAITPLIYDPKYIDFLFAYCKDNDIKLVISLFDIDLPVLSKNKKYFSVHGIDIIVSDEGFIDICNDKYKTYCWLKDNGFKTPVTYIDIDDCKRDILHNRFSYPLIVKPRWGMGSIGVYEAFSQTELEVFYNKVKHDIVKSYLKYESNADMEHSVIIQEKLHGQEYGIDVFNDLKGKYLSCVPKKKLAMRSGETDSAIIVEDNKLIDLAKKLSERSKHIANLDVDCFKVNDEYYVLEMNSRFGGQYPFSHLSGVNYPRAIIKMVKKEKVDDIDLLYKYNVVAYKNIQPVII